MGYSLPICSHEVLWPWRKTWLEETSLGGTSRSEGGRERGRGRDRRADNVRRTNRRKCSLLILIEERRIREKVSNYFYFQVQDSIFFFVEQKMKAYPHFSVYIVISDTGKEGGGNEYRLCVGLERLAVRELWSPHGLQLIARLVPALHPPRLASIAQCFF